MRRTWMLGVFGGFAVFALAGCMSRTVVKEPVVERRDTVVVTPAPAAVEPATPAPPPGQDPNFVPPGHGGTPPGQEKKESALEEAPAAPAAEEAPPAAPAPEDGEKPPAKAKGKAKGKAKSKKK